MSGSLVYLLIAKYSSLVLVTFSYGTFDRILLAWNFERLGRGVFLKYLKRGLSTILFMLLHLHLSLNHGVAGAPQTTSQPVSSILLCSPLPSGT